jgi:hypothetical protein
VLILLGVIAVAALVAHFTRERGPSYKGKTLDQWLEGYYTASEDPLTGLPTRQDHDRADAIRAMGTNALPRLLELTAFKNTGLGHRRVIGDLLLKLPFLSGNQRIENWKTKAFSRAVDASIAFGALGTNAFPAIPELAQRVSATNYFIVAIALWVLGDIGEAAMPALMAQLSNTNAPYRSEVIHFFRFHPWLVTNNSLPMPELISCLNDADGDVRCAATNALQVIAPEVLANPPPP